MWKPILREPDEGQSNCLKHCFELNIFHLRKSHLKTKQLYRIRDKSFIKSVWILFSVVVVAVVFFFYEQLVFGLFSTFDVIF